MITYGSRLAARLIAWTIANIAFYVLQQRLGWVVAFAVVGLTGSARLLARADFQKTLEERNGLPK